MSYGPSSREVRAETQAGSDTEAMYGCLLPMAFSACPLIFWTMGAEVAPLTVGRAFAYQSLRKYSAGLPIGQSGGQISLTEVLYSVST